MAGKLPDCTAKWSADCYWKISASTALILIDGSNVDLKHATSPFAPALKNFRTQRYPQAHEKPQPSVSENFLTTGAS